MIQTFRFISPRLRSCERKLLNSNFMITQATSHGAAMDKKVGRQDRGKPRRGHGTWEASVIYPDPQGGYTPHPSFHATPPPNHLKFKGGYQGGVYGGVYVIVMEGVKY